MKEKPINIIKIMRKVEGVRLLVDGKLNTIKLILPNER